MTRIEDVEVCHWSGKWREKEVTLSTWYDPRAGDDRRAQLLRIQRLPEQSRWLAQPAKLYRAYRDALEPTVLIANELHLSGAYRNNPLAEDHITQDATLLWSWACRWAEGYDGYRRSVQRRML